MTILSLTRSLPLGVSESVSRKFHHISLASLSKLDAIARQHRRVTSRLPPICILFVRHCRRHVVYVPATSHIPNQLFHTQSAARTCQCRRLVAMRDGCPDLGHNPYQVPRTRCCRVLRVCQTAWPPNLAPSPLP
jgi:hypothetical protein